jgi:hypothetical protein
LKTDEPHGFVGSSPTVSLYHPVTMRGVL